MGTIANVLVGVATLYLKNPWTESTWVAVGYTLEGVDLSAKMESETPPVVWIQDPVDSVKRIQTLVVNSTLAEATLANLSVVFPGASVDGNVLTFSAGDPPFVGVKLVGTNPAGFDRTIIFPKGKIIDGTEMGFRKNKASGIPFSFMATKPDGSDIGTLTDSAS